MDDPIMSDKNLLVTVEDLIYTAFGPSKRNKVNFKLLQRVLHILARQMRLLEQDVEIKIDEITPESARAEEYEYGTYSAEGDELSKEKRKTEHKSKSAEREGPKEHRHGKGEKRDGKGHSKDRERKSHAKDPAARRPARIGSIEIVTAAQFALLGKAVKRLEQITGPLPEPVLPDNETLRQDLAMGRASLQDTMQAVQLNARMQAAEQGLHRMTELLTQLAQAGMVPPEFASQVGAIEEYLQAATASGQATKPGDVEGTSSTETQMDDKKAAKKKSKDAVADKKSTDTVAEKKSTDTVTEMKSTATAGSQFFGKTQVTHDDMYDALELLKETLVREINESTARANHHVDVASNTSRTVADKLETAMQVDGRVTTLLELTQDYETQLSGLDVGIKTQVDSFQGQLVMMRSELKHGLALLETANNNAETAALVDLMERHKGLVEELAHTVEMHRNFVIARHQTSEEIASLLKCVEILQEQKTDRDEMIDGLRDKADLSRLAGLLYDKDFAHARSELEKRISKCYEIFTRQDIKWQDALSELMAIASNKAELVMLISLKDATNKELNSIRKQLHKLEIMLGEPKAAILTRKLARDASCGVCMTRALMELQDATHGKPLPLPALRSLRPPPLGAEQQPCFQDIKLAPPDIRDHTCRRWVGGSHTLIGGNIVKVKAEDTKLQTIPTKKFEDSGSDGRYYMMEEDIKPCAECNKLSTD